MVHLLHRLYGVDAPECASDRGVCSNWTGLASNNLTRGRRPSYATRSLVTRVGVATWLAAAKLGRPVLSRFVCYERTLDRWLNVPVTTCQLLQAYYIQTVDASARGSGRVVRRRRHNSKAQGLNKLWNFEARACIGPQKNLDFINKNVRLVIRTPFQKLRYYYCCISVLKIHSYFIAVLNASLTINLNGIFM